MGEFDKLPTVTPTAISLVIPACDNIDTDLRAWSSYLQELGWGYEILAVDDSEGGELEANAATTFAGSSHVRFLRDEGRRGFGAALRVGLAAAQHPLLAYAAAGQSYRPADLAPMLKWIDEVHLVAGYRVSADASADSFRSSWVMRRLAKTVFGVHISDLGCLFALARRLIFARIPVQSNGTFAHTEILAKANFLGCLMTETPVKFSGSQVGSSPWPGDRQQMRAEIMRLFRSPDFGPVEANLP
jgi:hypothetical protein